MGNELHSSIVPYGQGRSLECISVRDFEDYEPLDFREIYAEELAASALQASVQLVSQHAFGLRNLEFGESRQISNIDRISAFLGALAIKPFGKLSLVKSLDLSKDPSKPYEIKNPGITIADFRQSFIIEDNIDTMCAEVKDSNTLVPEVSRSLYIEHAAVHELIHLSGLADITYFTLVRNPEGRPTVDSRAHGTTLEKKESGITKGKFFEEGFATLCGHMYLWSNLPGVAEDERTEPKQSPGGTKIDLPIRHIFAGSAYSYAAWAVERLVEFSPQLWNTLIRSRRYQIQPEYVRGLVKNELGQLDEDLFDLVDEVEMGDLTDVMEAAYTIDCMVKAESRR